MSKSTALKVPRSACPISYSLDIFGDKWTLLIIKDIVYFGKKTFGEFVASDEKIARNILADRLLKLQQNGIIEKTPHPSDNRKDVYKLLDRGLDLIPILLDLAEWGAINGKELTTAPLDWLTLVRERRTEILPLIRTVVANGGSIFVGDNSVIKQVI